MEEIMPADNSRIRIGRDLNGHLVIGDRNTVVVGAETTDPAPTPSLHQDNTAEDHGTVYSAAHGDIHIHQDAGVEPRPPDRSEA
jgi:hypothetical protein